MGYIDGFEDIMAMETGFLQYTMKLLEKDYAERAGYAWHHTSGCIDKIPAVRFDKAKELVAEKYNRTIRNPYDLEPEEEHLIGQLFQRRIWCRFCICHPLSDPKSVRSMRWMIRQDARFTLSFDLLFRRTGDHNRRTAYPRVISSCLTRSKRRGMTTEGLEQYLDTFRHGMPPHGGLGIGLERLTMQLIRRGQRKRDNPLPERLEQTGAIEKQK